MLHPIEQHLNETPFVKGVINGRWRLHERNGEILIVELATANGRWIALHLDITGYPTSPPLGQFWDIPSSSRLAASKWPQVVGQAFRTDMAGLYIACDRTGLSNHPNWAQESPNTCWRSDLGIARYLSVVHNLLQQATFQDNAA